MFSKTIVTAARGRRKISAEATPLHADTYAEKLNIRHIKRSNQYFFIFNKIGL
jgi:hypothetical protein